MTAAAALTITELCERWRCHRDSILEAIRAGRLVAFRLGKRTFRVALAEVERFERTGGAKAAAKAAG